MDHSIVFAIQHLSENVDEDESLWSSSEETTQTSDSSIEWELIFKKRRKLHRILQFVEKVVPSYDNKEFKQHFRLDRITFNYILEQLDKDKVLPTHTFGREKINTHKALLLTVWYLGNLETFRQIADRFDVTLSSAHRVISKVIQYLVSVSRKYIQWPSDYQKDIVREGFRKLKGIEGIVGAIDGCHINIKRPTKNSYVYRNRKSDYSILLQGVCDHQKKFIDVFCGEAGSIHDARLLKRSCLYEKGMNGFLGNDFLLGDSAYPCLLWLIPPFRDNGHLTRNQKTFNYRHSASRIVIENAFGLLKGRFRRLKFFDNDNIIFIVQCVIAATVLHNICIGFDDDVEYEPEESMPDDLGEHTIYNLTGLSPAYSRRNEIYRKMFPND